MLPPGAKRHSGLGLKQAGKRSRTGDGEARPIFLPAIVLRIGEHCFRYLSNSFVLWHRQRQRGCPLLAQLIQHDLHEAVFGAVRR